MNQILIAGATGYLGSHLVRELQRQQRPFKAIARNRKKLEQLGLAPSQMILAEVTRPESLQDRFQGIDTLISTVGITRQKDGLTYMDVDYRANLNLLREAERAGVKRFVYVSAIGGKHLRHLKIFEAKERFVDALEASPIPSTVVRPNGFFSDMNDFLKMAEKGKVYLFGHGNYRMNPIHGADLAEVIVQMLANPRSEMTVGGPEILTQNEIATLALEAWDKPTRIVHLPDWMRRLLMRVLKTFTSSKTYGPYEFFLTMLARDNVAPRYGTHRLSVFLSREADRITQSH